MFGGMPLPQPGKLNVTAFYDNNPLHEYQVEIKAQPQPSIEQK
jgi:hypothetical protein